MKNKKLNRSETHQPFNPHSVQQRANWDLKQRIRPQEGGENNAHLSCGQVEGLL